MPIPRLFGFRSRRPAATGWVSVCCGRRPRSIIRRGRREKPAMGFSRRGIRFRASSASNQSEIPCRATAAAHTLIASRTVAALPRPYCSSPHNRQSKQPKTPEPKTTPSTFSFFYPFFPLSGLMLHETNIPSLFSDPWNFLFFVREFFPAKIFLNTYNPGLGIMDPITGPTINSPLPLRGVTNPSERKGSFRLRHNGCSRILQHNGAYCNLLE